MEQTPAKLCRTCMNKGSSKMISIFDTIPLDCPYEMLSEDKIIKIIIFDLIRRTCPQLEIEYNDNLPTLICQICEQKLLELYQFQQNALKVENKLREMFGCDDTMDPQIKNMGEIPDNLDLLRMEIMEPFIEFENCEDDDAECQNGDEAMKVSRVSIEPKFKMNQCKVYIRRIHDPTKIHLIKQSDKKLISQKKVKSNLKETAATDDSVACDVCGKILSSRKSLKRHKLIHIKNLKHSGKGPLEVKKTKKPAVAAVNCIAITSKSQKNQSKVYKENFKTHEKSNSSEQYGEEETIDIENPLACDVCDKILSTRNSLKRHKLIHTKDLVDKSELKIEQHMKLADAAKSHSKVDNVAIQSKSERNHCKDTKDDLNSQENENSDSSGQSDEELEETDKSNLKKTVTIVNPLACDICGKTFSSHKNVKRHKLIHTKVTEDRSVFEPYTVKKENFLTCDECGKSLSSKKSLKRHKKIHIKYMELEEVAPKVIETTYECGLCKKVFEKASSLRDHKGVHTGETPHECDICGRGFSKMAVLRKHKKLHGEKMYKCDFCDMRFMRPESCMRHMRTHTGEKPYTCKFCDRGFTQGNELKLHLRSHLGDNVYRCDLCPSGFRYQSELRAHLSSHENDDDETRAKNMKALQEEEVQIHMKFGLMSGLL